LYDLLGVRNPFRSLSKLSVRNGSAFKSSAVVRILRDGLLIYVKIFLNELAVAFTTYSVEERECLRIPAVLVELEPFLQLHPRRHVCRRKMRLVLIPL
jgi:hypothetical protein